MNAWEGKRVRLRAVEPDDWKIHFDWNRTSDIDRLLDAAWFPQSTEQVRRWTQETSIQPGQNDNFHFQIETLAGEMVGTLNTHGCNPRVGTFSYGVAVLPDHQRRGYANEAICLVLRHYFQERRYQKVTVTVYSLNEPSIRLHEHLGYQLEGRLRRMIYTQGQYFDELFYGLTAEEFAEKLLPGM
jgi:RimJ/RimL family protein N-acetyltransferase